MKLLIDTHLLIWMHLDAKDKMSARAMELLTDENNELFLS